VVLVLPGQEAAFTPVPVAAPTAARAAALTPAREVACTQVQVEAPPLGLAVVSTPGPGEELTLAPVAVLTQARGEEPTRAQEVDVTLALGEITLTHGTALHRFVGKCGYLRKSQLLPSRIADILAELAGRIDWITRAAILSSSSSSRSRSVSNCATRQDECFGIRRRSYQGVAPCPLNLLNNPG